VLYDLIAGFDLDLIRETLKLGELPNWFNEVVSALRWVQGLKFDNIFTWFAHVEIDRRVAEVTEVRNLIIDSQTIARQSVEVPMSFKFPWESIEDLAVEVAWGAIVFENFNDASCLPDFRVFDDLFFEIGRAYFLHMSSLLNLFTLVEVLQFTIKEFLN
jgi:hypothetical protein